MLTWQRGLVMLHLILSLAGCAGGQMFARPSDKSLTLNTTKYQDVVAKYGPPADEGTHARNQRVFKTVNYRYAEGRIRGNAYQDGVTPGKKLICYFLDDTLVGFYFSSSFKDDHTNFDHLKANSIKRGETTQAALIELLGPPAGEFIYPFATNAGDRELMYYYYHLRLITMPTSTVQRTYLKVLIVTINQSDVVTEFELSELGQW